MRIIGIFTSLALLGYFYHYLYHPGWSSRPSAALRQRSHRLGASVSVGPELVEGSLSKGARFGVPCRRTAILRQWVPIVLTTALLVLSTGSYANPVSPLQVSGAESVDVEEAKSLWMQGAFCIDPRNNADWEAGRIPGALHMISNSESYTAETVLEFVGSYDAPIVSYCNAENCLRAANLAEDLLSWGFTNVYYFRDGFPAWKNAHIPYE